MGQWGLSCVTIAGKLPFHASIVHKLPVTAQTPLGPVVLGFLCNSASFSALHLAVHWFLLNQFAGEIKNRRALAVLPVLLRRS